MCPVLGWVVQASSTTAPQHHSTTAPQHHSTTASQQALTERQSSNVLATLPLAQRPPLDIEDEIRTAYELGVIDGRQYLDCPVDEVAKIVDGEQYPTKDVDRHALSNKLITDALKRGDIK